MADEAGTVEACDPTCIAEGVDAIHDPLLLTRVSVFVFALGVALTSGLPVSLLHP